MRQFMDEPVGVEAAGLVTGQRQMDYGDPLVNYERFSIMLTAIFRTPVSRREAVHVMIALKMCRDLEHPLRDNEVDICGYAHLLQFDREDLDDEPEEKEDPMAPTSEAKLSKLKPIPSQRRMYEAEEDDF